MPMRTRSQLPARTRCRWYLLFLGRHAGYAFYCALSYLVRPLRSRPSASYLKGRSPLFSVLSPCTGKARREHLSVEFEPALEVRSQHRNSAERPPIPCRFGGLLYLAKRQGAVAEDPYRPLGKIGFAPSGWARPSYPSGARG